MNTINPERIVLFGGSFNPPGEHHRKILEYLVNYRFFNLVIVVPCGPRPEEEKVSLNKIDPVFRERIIRAAFAEIPGAVDFEGLKNVDPVHRLRFDMFDLYNSIYTRTLSLQLRYQEEFPQTEIWHYVGSDLVVSGRLGRSEIHGWGSTVWDRLNWFIITREGFELIDEDLPPHCQRHDSVANGSSTEIREQLSDGLDEGEVMERIAPLLKEFNPYLDENKTPAV